MRTLLVLLVLAAPVGAAPILLAEITQSVFCGHGNCDGPEETWAHFYFTAYTGASNGFDASEFRHVWWTYDDGAVATMGDTQLATWQAILTAPTAILQLGTLSEWGALQQVDTLWNGSQYSGLAITMHGPKLGPALSGYTITAITHTLEEFTPFDPYFKLDAFQYAYFASHSLRIYVEAVPEPTSWLLAAIGVMLFLQRRHSG